MHRDRTSISKIFSCQLVILRIRNNSSVGQLGHRLMVFEMSELDFHCELKTTSLLIHSCICFSSPSIQLITHWPHCRWSRGQRLVSEGEVLSLGRSVQRSDAGEYTCTAISRRGQAETQACHIATEEIIIMTSCDAGHGHCPLRPLM